MNGPRRKLREGTGGTSSGAGQGKSAKKATMPLSNVPMCNQFGDQNMTRRKMGSGTGKTREI